MTDRDERRSGDERRRSSNHNDDESLEGRERRHRRRDYSDDEESNERRRHRKKRSRRERSSRRDDSDAASDSDGSDSEEERRRRHKKYKQRRKEKRRRKDRKKSKKHKRSRRDDSSSGSDSEDDSHSSSDDSSKKKDGVMSSRLLAKLQARGETLEERKARRAARAEQKRAAFISTKFGYTAEDNPFHDPNLHQAFTWNKKIEQGNQQTTNAKANENSHTLDTLADIEKLRERRKQREAQMEEMERIRREESRMKELENFDDWAKKEEDFHLEQQRQRSAIRLVEGREKPIDVLAKNMLLFGIDRENSAAVKYKERYNAMEELGEKLEVEIEEPYKLLHMLKLEELEEVSLDIDAFLRLERDAASSIRDKSEGDDAILIYWEALKLVTADEIKLLKAGGGMGSHAKTVEEVQKIFQQGQSIEELTQMKAQIIEKLRENSQRTPAERDPSFDQEYWETVLEQLKVYLAKKTLSQIHSQMLVRQLERLERKRQELASMTPEERERKLREGMGEQSDRASSDIMQEDESGFGGVEDEAITEEVELRQKKPPSWTDKYASRKPRYFNRVKTGYNWNKYNKTHFDRDNPPPKEVQGYKFNIFYPDLIDPSKTPKFELLKADTEDYCIIKFSAGPPYEDVAFKIMNKEWNKSRKHGFKSSFERGILSLYFNFKSNWYRR